MDLITASVSLTRQQWLDLMNAAHATLNSAQDELREAEGSNWPEAEIRDCRTRITEAEALLTSLRMVRLPEGLLGEVFRVWVYDELRVFRESLTRVQRRLS